ncbi:FAD-dependent 5-carboxymethylaminomethyl-2-thiouridine(34) oxidoreductase MnmC [uncultured Shewanella sp.]|uniref:FAD-dependent 5-carboxymethylaminomethyl-2-thiouridine(34) oxidoreductase MnmC n=1 Tax=uncultured Shewanella sp. TaxID=173975 RepID=UPI002631464C|nr:FAD-dependent 5-carboxymethylaminomethyl-2-thiouridine(34) oxidoreductase MnmC [uncultured Shewanella sp.]
MTVSTLYQYVKTTKTDNSPIVLGQIGLGEPQAWLTLLTQHQKSTPQILIINIFIPSAASVLNLADMTAALTSPQQTRLININGIQRLSLNDERLLIDFHVGELSTQIDEMIVSKQHLISHWYCDDKALLCQMNQTQLWKMAKISHDAAQLFIKNSKTNTKDLPTNLTDFLQQAANVGFQCIPFQSDAGTHDFNKQHPHIPYQPHKNVNDDITHNERQALRHRQAIKNAPFPLMSTTKGTIAIIGGGLASANLALSLASRQRQIHLFCKDSQLAAQASGNKQGALYPLLTPENNTLSQFFQQAFLYSRRRLATLHQSGFTIAHDLCGVLHTGFDERSQARLTKIINGHTWDRDIAQQVDQQQASQLAGINIDKSGIFYPLGGWICPEDYTHAAINKAKTLTSLTLHFNCPIERVAQHNNQWYLYQGEQVHGPFASIVLANGHALTQFTQTKALQLSGFRGQVSHIPSKGQLSELNTVLCAHGYLTPGYKNTHCVGASYVKNAADLNFCSEEQNDNLNKMHHSYPNHSWVEDIDVSDNEARVGVRMVTRDHAPMMGPVPDVEQVLARYQQHQLTPESRQYWQTTPAPVHQGLYVLGGLGSRGLSSGPLAAEALAAMICGEPLPINQETVALLSPNRMWMRKLLKGKAL